MKAPRPLSRRECEIARLAAQRTKDDALALIARTAHIYRESDVDTAVRTLDVVTDILREHLPTSGVVTAL